MAFRKGRPCGTCALTLYERRAQPAARGPCSGVRPGPGRPVPSVCSSPRQSQDWRGGQVAASGGRGQVRGSGTRPVERGHSRHLGLTGARLRPPEAHPPPSSAPGERRSPACGKGALGNAAQSGGVSQVRRAQGEALRPAETAWKGTAGWPAPDPGQPADNTGREARKVAALSCQRASALPRVASSAGALKQSLSLSGLCCSSGREGG